MNKRIEKKAEKRDRLAHEQERRATSWGRISLSLEHVSEAFAELFETLREESGVWQQQARVRLQNGAQAVDGPLSPKLAKVPVVGIAAARGLHSFATDPHFAQAQSAQG